MGAGETTYRDQNGNLHKIKRNPGEKTIIKKDNISTNKTNDQDVNQINQASLNIKSTRYRCDDWLNTYERNDPDQLKQIEIYLNGYFDSINKNKPTRLERRLTELCKKNPNTPLLESVKAVIKDKQKFKPSIMDTDNNIESPPSNSRNNNPDGSPPSETSPKSDDSRFSCETIGKGSSCNKGNKQTIIINR